MAISLGRVDELSSKIAINISGPVRSFTVKENHIGPAVSGYYRSV